jgi:Na+-translocating ferredoxin:NAD+ oxidoreductase RnfG subunit
MFASESARKIILAIIYFVIGASIVGLFFFLVNDYTKSIVNSERADLSKRQLEQVVKENKELQKKTEQLEKANQTILNETKESNDKVVVRYEKVTEYINRPETQSTNRESSEVLKNTVRMLKDEE